MAVRGLPFLSLMGVTSSLVPISGRDLLSSFSGEVRGSSVRGLQASREPGWEKPGMQSPGSGARPRPPAS